MEFIDIINLGNGKYIKRYWKEASGKKEIVEIDSSPSAYTDYLEKKAIKEFRESGYGDKPWNYDSLKKAQNKDIAKEYAFYLVSESFIHLGGIMNEDELVYKGTKKWEEAKHITRFTIDKMTFNPFTNELIDESGFFKRVHEEINNL